MQSLPVATAVHRAAAPLPPVGAMVAGSAVASVSLAVAMVPKEGQPVPEAPVHSRQVNGVSVPPEQRVPSAGELSEVLRSLDFPVTLELGIAADLPVGFLRSLVIRKEPRWLLERLLQAACPLDIDRLNKVLDRSFLHAKHLAAKVELWQRQRGVTQLLPDDGTLREELVDLLSPLAERSAALAQLLGVPLSEIQRLQRAAEEDLTPEERRSILVQACQLRPRTCSQWLEVLARSGIAGWQTERLEERWQLKVPEGFEDEWVFYLGHCTSKKVIRDEVLQLRARQPEAPVPLSQVWGLLPPISQLSPAVAMVLEDSSHSLLVPDDQLMQTIRRSLVSCAAREGTEGLSWSSLQRLARQGFLSCVFASQLAAQKPEPEQRSRLVRPSDLVALVQIQEPERHALEVASVLGVGVCYETLRKQSSASHCEKIRALEIWRRIYNAIPGLETGHLVQLFHQMSRQELVRQLTGDPDTDLHTEQCLSQLCVRAAHFLYLFDELKELPYGAVDAYWAACGLNKSCCNDVPDNMGPVYRLLNDYACANPASRSGAPSPYALLEGVDALQMAALLCQFFQSSREKAPGRADSTPGGQNT